MNCIVETALDGHLLVDDNWLTQFLHRYLVGFCRLAQHARYRPRVVRTPPGMIAPVRRRKVLLLQVRYTGNRPARRRLVDKVNQNHRRPVLKNHLLVVHQTYSPMVCSLRASTKESSDFRPTSADSGSAQNHSPPTRAGTSMPAYMSGSQKP